MKYFFLQRWTTSAHWTSSIWRVNFLLSFSTKTDPNFFFRKPSPKMRKTKLFWGFPLGTNWLLRVREKRTVLADSLSSASKRKVLSATVSNFRRTTSCPTFPAPSPFRRRCQNWRTLHVVPRMAEVALLRLALSYNLTKTEK